VPVVGQIPLADTAYLKRRRGKDRSGYRWYVRIGVPRDLQGVIRKQTIERALNTSDFKEAQRLRHAALAEIYADFDRARRGAISSADIEHEAQRYLRERLGSLRDKPGDAFEVIADDEGISVGLEGQSVLWILQDALANEDWPDSVQQEAALIARRYGVSLSDTQRSELSRALLLAEIEALSRPLAIHRGAIPEPLAVLNAHAVDPLTAKVPPPTRLAPKQGSAIRVDEAAAAYIADRNRERRGAWTGQTLNQFQTTLRFFGEFTRNAPLDAITRKDVASFLTTIGQLDPNYGRRNAAKKLSLQLLLKKHTAPDQEGLSNRTLNRHGGVVAGLFDWAIRTGKLDGTNPARGHHRSEVDGDTDHDGKRRSFAIDELSALLAGPLFAVPLNERVTPSRHSIETALMWLIPLALFSGMRLDEMCGLRVQDMRREEGLLYFDLRSHEHRRLKTSAARRRVPVHSMLSQIGFESYLARVNNETHEYLFPALKGGGPDEKRSWYVSKRFTTYRRAVGVRASETVFHCFRKNAATALERARVPENEAVQILGHKKMTMSYGLYSGGLDLMGLQRVVEAISYPGLVLQHLYAPAP
jgi:integrase